ncbi:MAG: hypothetical protein A3G93_07150 [Nitrospinae bacterium RIFCSPLOWO2_12_FULL_45_22]|nr:MAG: hypothetical protein A3G93_07150 [Nitrospinae bacterium RIFCSPLOWO2_12_FULL_45_22]
MPTPTFSIFAEKVKKMHKPSVKRLIVTADDFGLTKGINQGIFEAFSKGIVTNTTLIVNGRAYDHALDLAKTNPGLPLGIHLTLMEERAVLSNKEIPTLVQKDSFLPRNYRQLILNLFSKKIRLPEIEAEFKAQIDKFLASGIKPTHIDSHQHIHMLPSIFNIVVKLAREYGVKNIRFPYEKRVVHKGYILSTHNLNRAILKYICSKAKQKIKQNGIITTDYYYGFLRSGALSVKALKEILLALDYGTTELNCHPGYIDQECVKYYSHWNYHWEEELKALTNDEIKGLITKDNIQLISYKDR